MIHLLKTLAAMRWIALLNGRNGLAKAIEQDIKEVEAMPQPGAI